MMISECPIDINVITFKILGKIPFQGMDYSPWPSKNLIDRNQLKKFMHVGVDVTCMYTDFSGCGLFSFGDKNSLWPITVEKFN